MLNKKTVAMAMAVATIAPTVAPIVANAAENVTEIQVSSGETEKIAKINAELKKAESITFTNNKLVESDRPGKPDHTEVYAKYEKNDMGTNVNVPVYKIERTMEGSKEIIKVTDRGHRVGYETTWVGETNTNRVDKVIYDYDEAGKDIEEKLVAKITIEHENTVNEYEIDAKELFKTNGKYNELGQRLVNYIKANMTNFTQETVVKGNTTGKKLTVIGQNGTFIVTVWGNPVVNTEDSTIGALAGLDRCETAVQVSQEGWKKSNDVILVGWGGTVDGLAAAPLASTINAPILVSNKTTLGKETKAEIDRLEAKTVYVVGGEKTVPQSIINELDAMGVKVERIAGEDRMRTSFAIAKKLDTLNDVTTTYFVGGYKGEADALSIAATAAKEKQPIILIEENRIADDVKIWLKEEKLSKANIIGGTYAINENINNDVAEIVGTGTNKVIERIQGKDVAETNAKVIERFHKEADAIFIAQDENLVDALAAGPLAAKKNAALVLATNKVTIDQKQAIEKTKAYKLFRKNLENGANINYTSVISNTIYQVGHGVSRSVVKFIENMFIQK